MMMELFTLYFLIKVAKLRLTVGFWAYSDFVVWNVFLVFPATVAVYVGAATKSLGRDLSVIIGKYTTSCFEDENLHRVSSLIAFKDKIIDYCHLKLNTLNQKLNHRLLQYRLAARCVSFRNDYNIYDHHLPV